MNYHLYSVYIVWLYIDVMDIGVYVESVLRSLRWTIADMMRGGYSVCFLDRMAVVFRLSGCP